MNAQLRAVIDNKNRQTAAANRQVFGKKANDQQHHANLLNHVNVLMDALRADIAGGMVISSNLREAMRELGPAVTLSKRRLEL